MAALIILIYYELTGSAQQQYVDNRLSALQWKPIFGVRPYCPLFKENIENLSGLLKGAMVALKYRGVYSSLFTYMGELLSIENMNLPHVIYKPPHSHSEELMIWILSRDIISSINM